MRCKADLRETEFLLQHKRLRERAWILPGKSYQNMIATTQPLRTSTPAGASSVTSSLVVPATQAGQAAKSSSAVPLGHQGGGGGGGSIQAGSIAADDGQGGRPAVVDAVDVDFDELWETISDLNDDDLEALDEDDAQWWGSSRRAKEGAQVRDTTGKDARAAQDDGRGDKRGVSMLVDDDDEEAAAAQQQGHRWRSSLTGPSGFRPITTAARR
ncbi:hypothetical protein FA10DRAFT_92986 [Acaromyces ingoldii]|uniref:Uncharacterized protein n=1 Tax=Acaromyces ingoldii TaxID=215250 RepID=A0A316YV02_9BASI|nr:hypothetical protein FA10DRAFT_92986 [Acaromyces ingoldii]PWN92468.1 hypothetical protein FA10DRAFT_92986 [Acaromyces ingoldii]